MCLSLDCVNYNTFINNWAAEHPNEYFVKDGPINCDYWSQDEKILFILKESYGIYGQNGYPRWETIPYLINHIDVQYPQNIDMANWRTLLTIICKASHYIYYHNLEIIDLPNPNRELLHNIAWINVINNDRNQNVTPENDLLQHYQHNHDHLVQQIHLLKPTHIVTSLGPDDFQLDHALFPENELPNTHLIRSNHPIQPNAANFNLYQRIIEHNIEHHNQLL